jgi:hypothetical protein
MGYVREYNGEKKLTKTYWAQQKLKYIDIDNKIYILEAYFRNIF